MRFQVAGAQEPRQTHAAHCRNNGGQKANSEIHVRLPLSNQESAEACRRRPAFDSRKEPNSSAAMMHVAARHAGCATVSQRAGRDVIPPSVLPCRCAPRLGAFRARGEGQSDGRPEKHGQATYQPQHVLQLGHRTVRRSGCGLTGTGCQLTTVRAQGRAWTRSVMPGHRQSSTAPANSPPSIEGCVDGSGLGFAGAEHAWQSLREPEYESKHGRRKPPSPPRAPSRRPSCARTAPPLPTAACTIGAMVYTSFSASFHRDDAEPMA